MSKNLFFVGLILAASGRLPPPLALAAGLVFGLTATHPCPLDSRRLSSFLLQASVVGLGFGMNLTQVMEVGRSGFAYTAISISVAMILGLALGRLLRVEHTCSFLITVGTAICGGSAIAAVGPIANATEGEMAVSLSTVFVLNSVALLLFPLVGWAVHLNQTQFGLWAALAIHDTSSVVGATSKYGAVALAVGTTVKLARSLWIVPLSVVTSILRKSKASIRWPWFIGLFCIAASLNTYLAGFRYVWEVLNHLGKLGLTVTLFLIGTALSKSTLREVGVRPLLQGALLWAILAVSSIELILHGWIAL